MPWTSRNRCLGLLADYLLLGAGYIECQAVTCVVAGSPFQYTVGKSPAGGTHKVDFGGVGVDKGQVGLKSKCI